MLNKIILMGRLTRDPESRKAGEATVASFTIATNEGKYHDRDLTQFIPCEAWGKDAETILERFHKGDGIMVEGRLESDKYVDKDGNNRIAWKIICDRVEFTPSRKSDSGTASAASGFAEPSDDDGEIPF